MEVNMVIVRILAERIINKGENPLKKRVFLLDDVTNPEYRIAVEDYILKNSAIDTGILEEVKEAAEVTDGNKEVEAIEEKKEDNKEENSIVTQ